MREIIFTVNIVIVTVLVIAIGFSILGIILSETLDNVCIITTSDNTVLTEQNCALRKQGGVVCGKVYYPTVKVMHCDRGL